MSNKKPLPAYKKESKTVPLNPKSEKHFWDNMAQKLVKNLNFNVKNNNQPL